MGAFGMKKNIIKFTVANLVPVILIALGTWISCAGIDSALIMGIAIFLQSLGLTVLMIELILGTLFLMFYIITL